MAFRRYARARPNASVRTTILHEGDRTTSQLRKGSGTYTEYRAVARGIVHAREQKRKTNPRSAVDGKASPDEQCLGQDMGALDGDLIRRERAAVSCRQSEGIGRITSHTPAMQVTISDLETLTNGSGCAFALPGYAQVAPSQIDETASRGTMAPAAVLLLT